MCLAVRRITTEFWQVVSLHFYFFSKRNQNRPFSSSRLWLTNDIMSLTWTIVFWEVVKIRDFSLVFLLTSPVVLRWLCYRPDQLTRFKVLFDLECFRSLPLILSFLRVSFKGSIIQSKNLTSYYDLVQNLGRTLFCNFRYLYYPYQFSGGDTGKMFLCTYSYIVRSRSICVHVEMV